MTSATTAGPTDQTSPGTGATAPKGSGADHSFTAGWVLLAVGFLLTMGVLIAVAIRGSVLDIHPSTVPHGTTPSSSTTIP